MNGKTDDVLPMWSAFQEASIRRSALKQSSIQTFNTTHKSLTDFCAWSVSFNGKPKGFVLTYDYLTGEGVYDYYEFLISCGLKNTTIHKRYIYYKKFLYWLGDKGHIETRTVRKIELPRLQTVQKKVVFLSLDELLAFFKLDVSRIEEERERYEVVKDSFLFACFTGLRFSDLYKFNWSEVEWGANRISYVSQKTSHLTYVELNDFSLNILKKYREKSNSARVFNLTKYNCVYNDYLKTLARLAGLNRMVEQMQYTGNAKVVCQKKLYQIFSSHIARRTFVCLCLQMDIRQEMVMKWTGHTSYRGIKPYIDVMQPERQMQMNKLNGWMNKIK